MGAPRICVVGSCNIDLVAYTERLPAPGETVSGTDFARGFGGKGANQAVMAARLGGRVSMVARLGDDDLGREYRAHLRAEGIDVDAVSTATEAVTGVASVWVGQSSGDNAIVIIGGANATLEPGHLYGARQHLEAADVVVCQWEVPVATVEVALRLARDAGAITVLNPAPANPGVAPGQYRDCDVVCPNETEAAALSGIAVRTADDAAAAAAALRARGAGAVVCTRGGAGAVVVDDAGRVDLPGEAVDAVDTTGAGDAFVGALAFHLGRGASLRRAVVAAMGIAGETVRRRGAQSSYPRRAELPRGLLEG